MTSEFIADYNNPMQPLSIELEVEGRYKIRNNGSVVTIIGITNSTITYETNYASSSRSAPNTTTNTGIDKFFKLLEPNLTHVRTFITNQLDGNSVYTMTSQPTSKDGVAAARSAVQRTAADTTAQQRKNLPSRVSTTSQSNVTNNYDDDNDSVVKRTEDTLYFKMEAARKANIAYSKGVNIAVTLTIPGASGGDRKYKFQILECAYGDSMNGKYHYNVWASEHAFCRELANAFASIVATNSSGKYYHEAAKCGIAPRSKG